MTQQTILVVDDEPPMRKLLASNLKASGYAVREATDGSEALKLIDEHPFDLLLLRRQHAWAERAPGAAGAQEECRHARPDPVSEGT